jgi:hypothetical protein
MLDYQRNSKLVTTILVVISGHGDSSFIKLLAKLGSHLYGGVFLSRKEDAIHTILYAVNE